MPGPFDWVNSALGAPNPYDEARAYQQAQTATNNAALGLGPGPQGQGAPPTGPDTLPPNQTPQATKTPKDLGSIMLDLQQYNQREQSFNEGLGGIFGGLSQPRDREWVSKMMSSTPQGDPTKIAESLMSLNSQQQGQNRMNALGALISGPQGDAIAQRLNISKAELIARYQADPQGVGNMIQQFAAPTDAMKNLEQINTYAAGVAGSMKPEDLATLKTLMQSGIAGPDAQKMILAQNAFEQKFGHAPSWKNDFSGFQTYLAQDAQRKEALAVRPTSEDKLDDLERKIEDIKNDPALPGIMKNLLPGQSILSYATKTDAERNLLQKIKQATSDEYVRGLADPGLGTRKTQQEMQYVGQSLGGILNASNIALPDYIAGLNRLRDQLYTTHADIYGQSGDFSGMDEKYKGYVNDSYRPGGGLNEGIVGAPTRQPLDDEANQFIKDQTAKGVPMPKIIDHLRKFNYDTSKLHAGLQ